MKYHCVFYYDSKVARPSFREFFSLIENNKFFDLNFIRASIFDDSLVLYNQESKEQVILDETLYCSLQNTDDYMNLIGSGALFIKPGNSYFYFQFSESNLISDNLINDLLKIDGLILGYVYLFRDCSIQSERHLTNLEIEGIDINKIAKVKNKMGKMEADVSKNYGREFKYKGINFNAAPEMWLGSGYFNYVSKRKFNTFKDYQEKKEFTNGLIYLKLFDYTDDPNKPENRLKQKKFWEATDMALLERIAEGDEKAKFIYEIKLD